jgi:putative transposase
LLVPQDREGTFSTRKVKSVTERLCDTSFSKSPVSSLADRLDSERHAWGSRPLEVEAYPYLFVDPRYEKVRVGHRIVSQGVLIVSAVRAPDGFREILGVEVTDTESEATYQDLFRSLKERVLKGVELGVSDDHERFGSNIQTLTTPELKFRALLTKDGAQRLMLTST